MDTNTVVEAPTDAADQRDDSNVEDTAENRAPENETVTSSLFGETVTDAELMGAETTEEAPEEPTENEEPQENAEDAEPPPEERTDATREGESKEAVKPPTGYVPLAALHEERGKRQAMSSRIQELEAAVATLSQGKPAEEQQQQKEEGQAREEEGLPQDFRVLSAKEYRDLAENDLVEAQIYLHNLNRFQKQEEKKQKEEHQRKLAQEQTQALIQKRYTEMEQAVPGIFAEDGDVNKALTKFAADNGMDETFVSVLTDPTTRIVGEDGRVVLLGKGAVQMLTLLNNAFKAAKPDATKEDLLKAQGAAELLGKIQNTTTGYRNIGGTPPGGLSVPNDPNRVVTEAELARMSPEEQERYLRGR
jgi:hypothetical protein